ncbi:MAG: fasciclin domain-containing protein, partial [Bacteroidaceae bacterium]|nr:fasciclin domain-containing protein [Bacteroidaceae bacterium]
MKRLFYSIIVLILLAGCKEEIDTSARYVFLQKTISQYLEEKDYYSEYVRLLGEMPVSAYTETTLKQLLSARGHYTVFAPTNDAIQLYLDSLCRKGIISEPSWDGFPDKNSLDSIKKVIVFNSILDSGDQQEAFDITDFPAHEHEFGLANMNNRKLRVYYGQTDLDSISIEGVATISKENRGILLSNGIIHQVEAVVAPSDGRLSDFMRQWSKKPGSGYYVMSKLILACGLEDTLNAYRDEEWERLYQTRQVKDLPNHTSVGQVGTIPEHRYFGFTLFAETDHFWEETLGKAVEDITVDDVSAYLQESGLFDHVPGTLYDENYKNEMNFLNQFVTYHILPQRIGREKLVIHYNETGYSYGSSRTLSIPIMDYYQTMGLPRMIKTYESLESNGIYLNRFPILRNGRGQFGPTKQNINDYHESGMFMRLKGSSTTPNENEGIR